MHADGAKRAAFIAQNLSLLGYIEGDTVVSKDGLYSYLRTANQQQPMQYQ